MVRRVFDWFTRELNGLHQAAFLLGLSAVASQLLGLLRDRLLAANFGAGGELDVYYAAFRIPDLLYGTIASLLSAAVVVPFLVRRLLVEESAGNRAGARRFLDELFSVFSVAMALAAILGFVLMPYLVKVVAPGFDPTAGRSLIGLSRIMLFSPFLLGLSNLFGAVTQALRRFWVYALTPLLYNLGIIVGIIFFYPPLGLSGLAWGVVLGACLHFLINLPVLSRGGLLPRLVFKIDWRAVREVILVSLPRTLTLSAQQLVLLILVALASFLATGSIAVFQLALNLQSVPLVIIGVSYSVAAFPTLSWLHHRGEKQEFVRQTNVALRHIIFWSLPATVLFIVLRAQIVRVILGAGRFDWVNTRLVAAALALFVISVAGQSLIQLLVRGYYAAGRTRRPFSISLVSSLATVLLAGGLLWFFGGGWGRDILEILLRVRDLPGTAVLLLPLAYSVGVFLNLGLLWHFFQKDFGSFPALVDRILLQGLGASLGAGVAAYLMLNVLAPYLDLNTFLGILSQGILAGLVGVGVFVFILRAGGNKELEEIWRSLHGRFWRTRVVGPEQERL